MTITLLKEAYAVSAFEGINFPYIVFEFSQIQRGIFERKGQSY